MKQKRLWLLALPVLFFAGLFLVSQHSPSLGGEAIPTNLADYAKQAGPNQKLLKSVASWHKEMTEPYSQSPDLLMATHFTDDEKAVAHSLGIYKDGGATLTSEREGALEFVPLPKGKLKATQIAQIKKLLSQLPPNQRPQSWRNLLVLTFFDSRKKPQSRLYNSTKLPPELRKIYQMTGAPLKIAGIR